MQVLADVRGRTGAAMILITHDLGLVAENADRVAVMYGGRIAEDERRAGFSTRRASLYRGLLASLPRRRRAGRRGLLFNSRPRPRSARPPCGCVFHPRCGLRGAAGLPDKRPEPRPVETGHRCFACHFAEETRGLGRREAPHAGGPERIARPRRKPARDSRSSTCTRNSRSAASGVGSDRLAPSTAFRWSSKRARRSAWSGEFGCGKSTLGRVVLGLHEATAGTVMLNGGQSVRRCRPAGFAPCGARCRSCFRIPMRRSIHG